MAVHTARTDLPCLTMHLGGLFNNIITEYFAGNKHAHIIRVVNQLTYLTVYEKGCKCLLTSHIRANPPTKLFPAITNIRHRYFKSYET
jgi:hypothetical protein